MVRLLLIRSAGAAGLVTATMILAASCASLEEIEAGYCGNRVEEPGEDCDGVRDGQEYACGARGAQHECRFVWEKDAKECPEGYVASTDKRCRLPSGEFNSSTFFEDLQGVSPEVADVDGDGLAEVGLTSSGNGFVGNFQLYSVAANGSTLLARVPTSGIGRIGDLSADGLGDLVVSVAGPKAAQGDPSGANGAGGLAVLRSRSGARDLKFYANDQLGDQVRFLSLPRWLFPEAQTDFDLDILGRLSKRGPVTNLCALDLGCIEQVMLPSFGVFGLSSDHDANHLVFSEEGASVVRYVAALSYQPPFQDTDAIAIPLAPEGSTLVSGAVLADVDADGDEDIVALGKDALSNISLYVLPGVGDVPWTNANVLSPMVSLETQLEGSHLQLRVAHFNDDELPDFVVGGDLLVAKRPLEIGTVAQNYRVEPHNWGPSDSIAVGDLNGDGRDDVAAPSRALQDDSQGGLEIVLGGELLPMVRVELEGPLGQSVSRVAIADFDGDGAGDVLTAFTPDEVAVAQDVSTSMGGTQRDCTTTDELVIAYGQVGGYPEATVSIGLLPSVEQIVTGRFFESDDGFGDYALAGECIADPDSITPRYNSKNAVLFGNPYRLVNSPFAFEATPGAGRFSPTSFALGNVIATNKDGFDDAGDPIAHQDIVVVGTDAEGTHAFLLPSWGDAELDGALKVPLTLPERWLPLASTGQVAIEASLGRVAFATMGITKDFQVFADFSVQTSLSAASDVVEQVSLAVPWDLDAIFSPFVQIESLTLAGEDNLTDYVMIYGGSSDTAVMGGGEKNGDGEVFFGGVQSKIIVARSQGASYELVEIEGLDEEAGEVAVDVVLVDETIYVVSQSGLYTVDVDAGRVVPAALAVSWGIVPIDAAVGDFNGDGLDDILVTNGFNGVLVEQLPRNP